MYLSRLRVRNYMIHRDTEVDLFPITVFVGGNNSGKSALFDALLNFSMVSRGKLPEAFQMGPWSFASRRYHGASATARISYQGDFRRSESDEEFIRYSISFGQVKGTYIIQAEKVESHPAGEVLFDRNDVDASPLKSVLPSLTEDRSVMSAIRRTYVAGKPVDVPEALLALARDVSRIGRYRLEPANLSRPSALPDASTEDRPRGDSPRVLYRGEGLASVLYHLHEGEDPVLTEIEDRMRALDVAFEAFEFNVLETDRVGFSIRFSDQRGSVPAANISDGTLSLLGLFTLLLDRTCPPIVCIEEPENGLTPRATAALYSTIKAIADSSRRPPTQVLISSHSPFVICEAWNGEDRDFIYRVEPQDGAAGVRPIADVLADEGVQLRKVNGQRAELGLRQADLVMGGFYTYQ